MSSFSWYACRCTPSREVFMVCLHLCATPCTWLPKGYLKPRALGSGGAFHILNTTVTTLPDGEFVATTAETCCSYDRLTSHPDGLQSHWSNGRAVPALTLNRSSNSGRVACWWASSRSSVAIGSGPIWRGVVVARGRSGVCSRYLLLVSRRIIRSVAIVLLAVPSRAA